MSSSQPSQVRWALLASVVGLGLCIALAVLVLRTPAKLEMATASYHVFKPVREKRVKTFTYKVHKPIVQNREVGVVADTRTAQYGYTVQNWVGETKQETVQLQHAPKEWLKLYVTGFFAALFALYFLVLIWNLIRTARKGEPPSKFLQSHLGKCLTLVVGVVGGFALSPETPQTSRIEIPPEKVPEKTVAVSPEIVNYFQKTLDAQEKDHLKNLAELAKELGYKTSISESAELPEVRAPETKDEPLPQAPEE